MKWGDVFKRDDIVGGDLEVQEDGDVYRGPIKSLELENGVVTINWEWCAKMTLIGGGVWRAHNLTNVSLRSAIDPQELGDKRILIMPPLLGVWVIFPKGGSKLDPTKVVGLRLP